MPARGKLIAKHHKFLDKVHMDIVFGHCMALGGTATLSFLWMLPPVTHGSMACKQHHQQVLYWHSKHSKSKQTQVLTQKHITPTSIKRSPAVQLCVTSINIAASLLHQLDDRPLMAIGLVEATWKTVVRSGWRAQLCRSTCSNHAQSSSRTSRSTSYYSVRTRVGTKPDSSTWFELFSSPSATLTIKLKDLLLNLIPKHKR